MSFLRRGFAPPRQGNGGEQRAVTSSSFIPPPGDWVWGGEGGGPPIGDYQALTNVTVFSCVQLLANTIAALPMVVYRNDDAGFPQKLKKQPSVIDQPCPSLTAYDFKWMMVESLAMRGNAYFHVTGRDDMLWPTGLMPIHPDLMEVDVPPAKDGYQYDWTSPRYRVGGVEVPSSDILHIKRFVQPGNPRGLSPIRAAAATIGMALKAEEYGYRYFRDAAMPSGALMTDQPSTAVDVPSVQKEWISTHGGRRLPAVLTGGFKWEPISISPEESQFLQTRQFQDWQIMRLFGIPPHMLGDHQKSTSWGTGIEQLSIGFLTFTLVSWLECMQEPFTRIIPRGQYMKFDPRILLRGDTKSRMEANQIARYIGAKNADEIRADEDLPPTADGKGNIYWQPTNMAPAGFDPTANQLAAAKAHADALAKQTPPAGDNGSNDPESETEGQGNANP